MKSVVNTVKRCIIAVIDFFNSCKIHFEFYLIRLGHRKTESHHVIPSIDGMQLFLVPHADDDLLGGYGLAVKNANLIYGYYGLTGSNSNENNRITRDAEFRKYADVVEKEYLKIGSYKDLEEIFRKRDIKRVYLPSIIDWHNEHRKLNYDLLDVLNNQNYDIEIYWYSVTVPICSSRAVISPLNKKEQNRKYNIFTDVYKSQNHMPLKRFVFHEVLNACGTEYCAAEVSLKLERNEWEEIVRKIRKSEPDLGLAAEFNKLKKKINSIIAIRRKSKKIYNMLLRNKGF